jgi:hypothetical protein
MKKRNHIHITKKKRQYVSPKILEINRELERLKKEGLVFPETKPLERMQIPKKVKKKKEPKGSTSFSAWENKDRYSYRKI